MNIAKRIGAFLIVVSAVLPGACAHENIPDKTSAQEFREKALKVACKGGAGALWSASAVSALISLYLTVVLAVGITSMSPVADSKVMSLWGSAAILSAGTGYGFCRLARSCYNVAKKDSAALKEEDSKA